ncbi:MAG: nitroreductase family protein [Bacteroidetes bacterium]|nr:nitroreductase family protein [Bacteroidota bacterium]
MNFLELAKSRYSVRNYLPKPVEEEKLNYILECGRIAPSAANYQPWMIDVIRDPDLKKKLEETYAREWLKQAAVILVFLGNHKQGWKRSDGKDHTDIDIAIMADHITLAAAEQGLGTCWICNFDAAKCIQVLNLPVHLEPIAYLSLGYPAGSTDEASRHLKRKPFEEIIKFDHV